MGNFKDKPKTKSIHLRVDPDEYETIEASAKDSGLSMAAYLRTLGTEYQVKGKIDQQALLKLLKTASDLGRLGGLLKLWLAQRETHLPANDLGIGDINSLYQNTKSLQKKLYEKVEKI